MLGLASLVEEHLRLNILPSTDRHSNPTVRQDFFAQNLFPILCHIEFSKKLKRILQPEKPKKQRRAVARFTLSKKDM